MDLQGYEHGSAGQCGWIRRALSMDLQGNKDGSAWL